MHNPPKNVVTNQLGIHENLTKIVRRHLTNTYQKPIQEHNQLAFEHFLDQIKNVDKHRLIMDSCCGTGMSSLQIAKQYPNHFVVAVDQSSHRLHKQKGSAVDPRNLLFIQANCEDFWRLCLKYSIRFTHHFILYPNPWPKSQHMARRWHGHPVFPLLKDLSNHLQLRSNWKLYLDEFSMAWELLTESRSEVECFIPESPMTLFEKKYYDAGQLLYRLDLAC